MEETTKKSNNENIQVIQNLSKTLGLYGSFVFFLMICYTIIFIMHLFTGKANFESVMDGLGPVIMLLVLNNLFLQLSKGFAKISDILGDSE